jgi:hypothetical protein
MRNAARARKREVKFELSKSLGRALAKLHESEVGLLLQILVASACGFSAPIPHATY